jgi:Glycosyl hydrolase catalytic core
MRDSLLRYSRSSLCRLARMALVLGVLALLGPHSAFASKGLVLGLFDDSSTLGTTNAFPLLESLHVQVVRMTLTWGGRGGVANRRPAHPSDPGDPAYEWSTYDRAIERANDAGIQVLLTIVGTPAWANGGQPPSRSPSSSTTLRQFAFAAALRYSGTYLDPESGRILPRVGLWLAWNEPNNPVFLTPQFVRVRGNWRMASPTAYAHICNAIYAGVHAVGGPEQVACGATAPRGSNQPNGFRPSIAPLAFLVAVKRAGLRTFDAWAHHPYYGAPDQTPATQHVGPHAIELGNIGTLIATLTRLYGPKRVWITEYGYQTKPPDDFFGVSWEKQAAYLREAYEIARANPRIDLFTWFLLRDSPSPESWQSGLMTADGRKKPSFGVFAHLVQGNV